MWLEITCLMQKGRGPSVPLAIAACRSALYSLPGRTVHLMAVASKVCMEEGEPWCSALEEVVSRRPQPQ